MPRGGKRPGAGRPKGSRNRATVAAGGRTLTELARAASPRMIEVLERIALDPAMTPAARVSAANGILDRALPRVRPADAPAENPSGPVVIQLVPVSPKPPMSDQGESALHLVEAQ